MFIVNFSISFLFLRQDIGKAFRQMSLAAACTSASPSLDKIGVCYEEMAGLAESQPAKVIFNILPFIHLSKKYLLFERRIPVHVRCTNV